MPVLDAAHRTDFIRASQSYAASVIERADKNGNGNLTRAEAKAALGDLKDTFDLYAESGKTVKTADFAKFYGDYVRVNANRGELPTDLADNYTNWLALRTRPAPSTDTGAIVNRVLEEYGLSSMGIEIDAPEARAQDELGAVKFEGALRKALDSFLKDGDDPESPYGLIAEDEMYGRPRAEIEAKVKDYLNQPSTTFRLHARGDLPEHGESTDTNWVFGLYIDTLSDHGHWAIVDRASGDTYNYGFN